MNEVNLKNGQRRKKPELLSPAGSPLSLDAAIDGGADAVYMGGTAFNARINAKNFTPEELSESIARAHTYGVRVYLTLNTQVYDRELDDALFAAEDAYLRGADALIVADLGLASEIRKRIPIELHGSTQMSGHGLSAAKMLSEHGFTRMVCARELGMEDIKYLAENSPIEIEAFVHGALCVCHSGQCLFSSIVGGRSGNRGECAQPCRLPFLGRGRSKIIYPLSLKDLSLARYVPELCDMGVASFKIEGRMKSPEYVKEVTSVFRALIDEGRGADRSDMASLAAAFTRGGFTSGYYTGNIDKKMLGVRSEDDKESSRQLEEFSGLSRRIPINMSARLRAGESLEISASLPNAPELRVSVRGSEVMEAQNAPLDEAAVLKNLGKLGNTPFVLDKVDIDISGRVMLPLSALNSTRRKAVNMLSSAMQKPLPDKESIKEAEKSIPCGEREAQNVAVYYKPENITDKARAYFDIIYTPIERYIGNSNGVMLPAVIFDSQKPKIEKLLAAARDKGAEHLLVGNIGHIEFAEKFGYHLHGDLRLNICNSSSAAFVESLGFEDLILSPELSLAKMRDIGGRALSVVYGKLPLMVTEKCLGTELGGCGRCEEDRIFLTDRRGVDFTVMRTFEHRSIIFNSVPIFMADREDELSEANITGRFFIFSDEAPKQIDKVIRAYKYSVEPWTDVRRIK